jgi:hypothetical protein
MRVTRDTGVSKCRAANRAGDHPRGVLRVPIPNTGRLADPPGVDRIGLPPIGAAASNLRRRGPISEEPRVRLGFPRLPLGHEEKVRCQFLSLRQPPRTPVSFGPNDPRNRGFAGGFREGELENHFRRPLWGRGEPIFLQNLCIAPTGIVLGFVILSAALGPVVSNPHPQPTKCRGSAGP